MGVINVNNIVYRDVDVKVSKEINCITVGGPLGYLKLYFCGDDIEFYENNYFFFFSKASYNTFYSKLMSCFQGVVEGYFIELNIIGLGYRFIKVGSYLIFKVGYGHYIKFKVPYGTYIVGYKKRIIVFGLDYEVIKRIGSVLKSLKKIDNYKGKGIKYLGEEIILKVGKQQL